MSGGSREHHGWRGKTGPLRYEVCPLCHKAGMTLWRFQPIQNVWTRHCRFCFQVETKEREER